MTELSEKEYERNELKLVVILKSPQFLLNFSFRI